MTASPCAEFSELAPEVALGLLSGDERAQALGHLAGCPTCRDHLDGLIRASDALLLLAPPGEPAVGFESRVIERLGAEGAFTFGVPDLMNRGRKPGRRGLAVAAALIVVAAVSGLAAGRSTTGHSASGSARSTPQAVVVMSDGGRSTCQLVAFGAHGSQPARVVVHLDEPGEPTGTYQVLAEPADGGAPVSLGTVTMADGQAVLSASIPAGTGPVHAVRVLDPSHSVKYRATFRSI